MIEFRPLEIVGESRKLGQDQPIPVCKFADKPLGDNEVDDSFLDAPLFSPNPPIHVGELNVATSQLISGHLNERFNTEFTEEHLRRLKFIGSGPTCREAIDFVAQNQPDLDFVVPVSGGFSGYVLEGSNFHGMYANKQVPVLDIHDLMLHSLQFRDMGDTLVGLNGEIAESYEDNPREGAPELSVAYYALAEYTIINRKGSILSFGALNWQYMRKSPAYAMQEVLATSNTDEVERALRWNSLRAVSSLSRRAAECGNPGLVEQLGYVLDDRIATRVEPGVDLDLSDIFPADQDPFRIHLMAPKRRQLEANVMGLVTEHKESRASLNDDTV